MLAVRRTSSSLAAALRPVNGAAGCVGHSSCAPSLKEQMGPREQYGIALLRRGADARASRGAALERSIWKPWGGNDTRKDKPLAARDALGVSSWFKSEEVVRRHRPATAVDVKAMKRVGGNGKPSSHLSMEEIEDMGLRMQGEVCSQMQEQLLIMEVNSLIELYGFSHIGEYTLLHTADVNGKILDTKNHVNTMRVTGRPESGAPVAPWGYGDDFDVSKVPEQLRFLMDQIGESPLWAVGNPRDITINKRENGFFKLDPHTDPVADGGNVFIVNLLSNSVITFVPPGPFQRQQPHKISLQSWTDQDIDVLMMRRSMVLFSGKSRMLWKHAIRTGVQVEVSHGEMANCDWWGEARDLVRRAPERISVVMAFDDPIPKFDEYTGSRQL